MKNLSQLLQILVIGFACITCVPLPMRHYDPEANGGRVIYDRCTVFNGHIPDEILLTERGVRTYTRLNRYEGKRYVEVRFEIPEEGKTVQLVETSARLFSNETGSMTEIEFPNIYL